MLGTLMFMDFKSFTWLQSVQRSGHLKSGLNSLVGMQPKVSRVVWNDSQLDPGQGSQLWAHSVRTLCLPNAIGTTCSQYNVLKGELDSHANTCLVG